MIARAVDNIRSGSQPLSAALQLVSTNPPAIAAPAREHCYTGAMQLRERIAAMVAERLEDDTFVNVGIGIPGLVPHHTPDERGILFHAEHGVWWQPAAKW